MRDARGRWAAAAAAVLLVAGCAAKGGGNEASLRRDTLEERAGYEQPVAARDERDERDERDRPAGSLLEAARQSGGYATFLQAVEAAGWHERLTHGGDFTLLAPTDAAFAALPPERLAALLQDRRRLERFVAGHVVRGRHSVDELAGRRAVRTAAGRRLTPRWTGEDRLFLDGAEVVQPDVEARNGVLHGVDAVLAVPEGRR